MDESKDALRRRIVKLETEAATDVLTGLRNRRYAMRMLMALAARDRRREEREPEDRRKGTPAYVVLMFDIDHFKRVNDTYGHAVGDDVLVGLATVLAATCRVTDVPIRWGGEEFLVICHNTTPEDALALAQRICLGIEMSCVGEAVLPWRLTTSVGVAYPRNSDEAYEFVIGRADDALYMAKDQGRNRVVQLIADAAA